jgi:UPF0755 protein
MLDRMLETTPRRAERRSGRRRGRKGLVILAAVVFILVVIAGMGRLLYGFTTGASGIQRPVVFTVPSGTTGNEVAALLEDEGIIRSALGFRAAARVRGSPLEFEAGEYNLKTNMAAGDVLDVLEAGPAPVVGVSATFPEGLRIEQTATRAADQLGIGRDNFIRAATSGRFALPPFLPEGTVSVEGFLFPSTYDFRPDVNADDVIERLIAQFDEEAAALPWDNAQALGLTEYEVVIVASLIEREARFPEDRANISAVIHNRLAKGMRLEIDATVQYALGDWEPILIEDREVDSPYNTYRVDGLPPSPIASPGLVALEAALQPADADYLYYVVIDAEGHHAFTDSYDEFLRLVDQYQG